MPARNARLVTSVSLRSHPSLPCISRRPLVASPPRASNGQTEDGAPIDVVSDSKADEPVALASSSGRGRGAEPGTDRPSRGGDPRQSLLQRIALSFAGILSALSPARLRNFLATRLTPRMVRLSLFFGIGICISLLGSFTNRRSYSGGRPLPQEVVYSQFLTLVNSGNVRAARFEDGTGRILFDVTPHSSEVPAALPTKSSGKGSSKEASAVSSGASDAGMATVVSRGRTPVPRQFYTRHLPDPQLVSTLMAAGVEFGSVRASMASAISRVLVTAMALWIPLIPMFIIMRRFLEGRNGTKKQRKGNSKNEVPPITFADVAGVGAAKEELQEVVACLRDARRFARLGAKLPSGVLLCGPPGTGKTLLAKAVAGEAGVPFIAVSASEFVEMFVGRGAARIRELFAEARRLAPCVVFIDELDAVGGKRGAGLNEERDQTLNQLLTELDGFEGRQGVLLLAATNRADVLDAALLRPGRLSRKVNVPLPDAEGRAAILAVHMRNVPLQGGEAAISQAADIISRISSGFSGAELANVVNEAAFLAARRSAATIELADLAEAVSRTRYGVNGGGAAGPGTVVRKLQKWLLDSTSGEKTMKTQPLGS